MTGPVQEVDGDWFNRTGFGVGLITVKVAAGNTPFGTSEGMLGEKYSK